MRFPFTRTMLLALSLACASAGAATASAPASGAEALERVIARFAGGQPEAARDLLAQDPPEGLKPSQVILDVIGAASGDLLAAQRILSASWSAAPGHDWLRLEAAKSLAKEHPILATSLASSLLSDAPSGRAARGLMVRTMWRSGATSLAAKTLAEGFGDPELRLQGISRHVLHRVPPQSDPMAETERGWLWLDQGDLDRAATVFRRALARAEPSSAARCWAVAGATRAALRSGRRETGWEFLVEVAERCPELPMAEEHDVWLARMAFGRKERAIHEGAMSRIQERGPGRLRLHGLDSMAVLRGAKGGLLVLARDLRERYEGWPFHDALNSIATQLWTNFDKRRKHRLAIEMLQPIVQAGYTAPRERSRGELAYNLARSYRRSGQDELAEATLIQGAYQHPLSWYGILAMEELRESAPYLALATEHTIFSGSSEAELDPQWERDEESRALRERLTALTSFGLSQAVIAEAEAAAVARHPGRAAWVARQLTTVGAAREASKLAHQSLAACGARSPLDGHLELWHLAYPRPFRSFVERHAKENGVDPRLTWAVMRIESRYGTTAESHAGAKGLLQIMPKTADWLANLRRQEGPIDLFDPLLNIDMASELLGRLHERFVGDIPKVLVAYNAGSGRTRRWLREVRAENIGRWVDRLPIAQAKNYVRSVMSAWALYRYLDGSSIGLAPHDSEKAVAQNL